MSTKDKLLSKSLKDKNSPKENINKISMLELFHSKTNLQPYLTDSINKKIDNYLLNLIDELEINELLIDFRRKFGGKINDKSLIERLKELIESSENVYEEIKTRSEILHQMKDLSSNLTWKDKKIPEDFSETIEILCSEISKLQKEIDKKYQKMLAFYIWEDLKNENRIDYGNNQQIDDTDEFEFFILSTDSLDTTSRNIDIFDMLDNDNRNLNIYDYISNEWSDCSTNDPSTLIKSFEYKTISIEYDAPLLIRNVWKIIYSDKFQNWFNEIRQRNYLILKKIQFVNIIMFKSNIKSAKFKISYKNNSDKLESHTKTITYRNLDAYLPLLSVTDKKKKISQVYVVLINNCVLSNDRTLLEIPMQLDDIIVKNSNSINLKNTNTKSDDWVVIDLGIIQIEIDDLEEQMHLHAYKKQLTEEEFKEFKENENAPILFKFVKYEDVLDNTNDFKTLCAILKYDNYLKREEENKEKKNEEKEKEEKRKEVKTLPQKHKIIPKSVASKVLMIEEEEEEEEDEEERPKIKSTKNPIEEKKKGEKLKTKPKISIKRKEEDEEEDEEEEEGEKPKTKTKIPIKEKKEGEKPKTKLKISIKRKEEDEEEEKEEGLKIKSTKILIKEKKEGEKPKTKLKPKISRENEEDENDDNFDINNIDLDRISGDSQNKNSKLYSREQLNKIAKHLDINSDGKKKPELAEEICIKVKKLRREEKLQLSKTRSIH